MRVAVHGGRVQPDLLHDFGHHLAAVAPGVHRMHAQPLGDHLFGRHARRERAVGILEHDLHVPPQGAQAPGFPALDVLAEKDDRAIGRDQPHHCQCKRRLARAAFADHTHGFALAHRKRGGIDRLHMAHGAFEQPPLDGEPDAQVFGARHFLRPLGHRRGSTDGLGAQQFHRVGVTGVGEDRFGRAALDDLAVTHHADPVGDAAHDTQIVGDEQHRHVLGRLQPGKEFEDLGLDGDVERGGGFVCDQQIGAIGQRHGDHHPLPLPARELVRIGTEARFGLWYAHLLQQIDDARPRRRPAQPLVQGKAFGQLLFQRVQRVERGHRLLEDEGDVVAAHLHQLLFRRADQLLAAIEHRAGHPGAVAQQRDGGQCRHRLARAALAHQGHGFAPAHREGHAPYRLYAAPVLAEGHRQVPHLENAAHWKVFRGSKASRTPSKMNTSSESMIA